MKPPKEAARASLQCSNHVKTQSSPDETEAISSAQANVLSKYQSLFRTRIVAPPFDAHGNSFFFLGCSIHLKWRLIRCAIDLLHINLSVHCSLLNYFLTHPVLSNMCSEAGKQVLGYFYPL